MNKIKKGKAFRTMMFVILCVCGLGLSACSGSSGGGGGGGEINGAGN